MARFNDLLAELHVTVRFPDVAPDDLAALAEAQLLAQFDTELADRLADLQRRIGRMLLTLEVGRGGR